MNSAMNAATQELETLPTVEQRAVMNIHNGGAEYLSTCIGEDRFYKFIDSLDGDAGLIVKGKMAERLVQHYRGV